MAILSKAGITSGSLIEASHVTQIIDALTSSGSVIDILVTGSFRVAGTTQLGILGTSTQSPLIFNPDTSGESVFYIKNPNGTLTIGTGGNPYAGSDYLTLSPLGALDLNGNLTITNNLGVGTTNPLTKLAVSNNGSQSIEMGYSAPLNANFIQSYDRVEEKNVDLVYYMASGVTGSHRFYTNGSQRMVIDPSGYVGIGTATPISPLNVNGTTIITGSTTLFNNEGTLNLKGTNSSVIQWYPDDSTRRAYFGFSPSSPGNIILENETTSGNIAIVAGTGYIGINKYTPTTELDVNGNATITGSVTATGTIASPTLTSTDFSSTNASISNLTTTSTLTTDFSSSGTVTIGTPGVDSDSHIQFWPQDASGTAYYINDSASIFNIGSGVFTSGFGTDVLSIANTVGVGIKKNIPNTALDVNGNALITGSLTTTGNVLVTGSITLTSLITASGDIRTSGNIRTRGGLIDLGDSGGNRTAYINSGASGLEIHRTTNHPIWFSTNGTEKMRITEGGNVGIGTVAPSQKFTVIETVAADTSFFSNTNASFTNAVIVPATTRAAGSDCFFIYGTANSVNTFQVYNNGNVRNTNNSYLGISDRKLKENIVNTTPKLEKLKQVRIVNYNFKEDLGFETFTQIGVIAQELEQVFPGLIEETPDRDAKGKLLNTTTKSVKYSVFVPILIKAVQEQQAQIEELKLQVATLISGSI